MDSVT